MDFEALQACRCIVADESEARARFIEVFEGGRMEAPAGLPWKEVELLLSSTERPGGLPKSLSLVRSALRIMLILWLHILLCRDIELSKG